jgi:hypothetical protein
MENRLRTLFLIPLLLSSCLSAADNAPEELKDYLSSCSIERAMAGTKTIKETFLSSFSERSDGEEIGSQSLTLLWDGEDADDFYYRRDVTYSGNQISLDEDVSLYVTEKTFVLSYDESQSSYIYEKTYVGKESLEASEETTAALPEERYDASSARNLMDEVFYTSSENGLYTGGLYYADFFSELLAYHDYMSIDEENRFVYKLENIPMKNDQEQGLVSETIHMNSLGLILDETWEGDNYTTQKHSSLSLSVVYNEPIERI